MTRLVALAACWAVLPLAGARGSEVGLTVPRPACLLDRAGELRLVHGVPGGYVLGAPIHSGVLAAACGQGFALVKTARELVWLDGDGRVVREWPAPGGSALLGLRADRAEAVVHFPETGQWFLAAPGALQPLPVALGSEGERVLSVAWSGRDALAAVVCRLGRLWLVRTGLDGRIREERQLAEAVAPILVLDDGAIAWGAGEGLIVQQQNGAKRDLPLPAPPAELQPAGERAICVRLAGGRGRLLVQLGDQRLQLYRLPEASR